MALSDMRAEYSAKLHEARERLQFLQDKDAKHFRQEGDGPLQEITDEIRAEYHRHIETYATLIAEIDAILGV